MPVRTAQPSRGRARRRPRRPDEGVTVIVGLLLALAIITALLINYRLQWVPLAQEDRQAAHMDTVNQDMAALVATLDKQLIGQVNTTVSSPIRVGVPADNFPTMPPVAHQVLFESTRTQASGYEISATQARLFEQDGTWLGGLEATYTSVSGSAVLPTSGALHELHQLRLKVDSLTRGTGSVTMEVTNQTGANLGWFELSTSPQGPGTNFTVTMEVRDTDATGEVLYHDERFHTAPVAPFLMNLLDDNLQLDQLIAAPDEPLLFTFTTSGMSASYAATYEDSNNLLQTSGGRTISEFNTTLPSSRLTYAGLNTEFVDQSLIVESGALLLTQQDGAGFLTEPRFTPRKHGDTLVLSLTVPRLTTADEQISGVTDLTIRTTPVETGSMKSWVPDLNLTVTTDHPQAWANFLERAMTDAGVPSSYYSVTPRATNATLLVVGSQTGTTEDVLFLLDHTRIRAEVIRS